jgi:hypothetical protein
MMVDVPDYQPIPGDIGLTSISGKVGRSIKLGQWLAGDGFHDLSHAFTYVGDGKIMEAMPGGARMAELIQYESKKIMWLRCPEQYGEAVARAAISFHGVKYAFSDYGALALHRFHIPTPRLKWFIARRKSMICSQLCDRAALTGGWHIFDDGRWSGYVTPGDLYKCAIKSGGQPGERYKVSR